MEIDLISRTSKYYCKKLRVFCGVLEFKENFRIRYTLQQCSRLLLQVKPFTIGYLNFLKHTFIRIAIKLNLVLPVPITFMFKKLGCPYSGSHKIADFMKFWNRRQRTTNFKTFSSDSSKTCLLGTWLNIKTWKHCEIFKSYCILISRLDNMRFTICKALFRKL